MWARVKLDIGWSDLAYALWAAARGGDQRAAQAALEAAWSSEGAAIACISLRSGFDLMLQAMLETGDLAPGDEVLFSALNVKQMVRIVERLGLTPVPVDLDLADMSPRLDLAAAAAGTRARVFVVAHLFGARIDMAPIAGFARRRGLLLVEDCAQAYAGPAYQGDADADVSMFSFGPIKTRTALGGGVLIVRPLALRARMRAIQNRYPAQPAWGQATRTLKFAALKALTSRPLFGLATRALAWRHGDYDAPLADAVRGVARQKTPRELRRACSAGLSRLMLRRLRQDVGPTIAARRRLAGRLRAGLDGIIQSPGDGAERHDYWVFPLIAEDPARMVRAMRQAGFDAAGLPRSEAIRPPADRPELKAVAAERALAGLIVTPCYPGMDDRDIDAAAAALRAAVVTPPTE